MPSKSTLSVISENLSAIPVAQGIPKVIYQVFASKDLPPMIQENVSKIRNLNPDWDYRFYDDADMVDFIREAYGNQMLAYYDRINPKYGAARADLFRYLLMYKCGGVYLDIKSSLQRPLSEVLLAEDAYVLSRWSSGKGEVYEGWGRHAKLKDIGGAEFQQWHIIAAPGHPFLRAVLERVLDNIDSYNPIFNDTGKEGVLSLTGPIAYTLAITPLLGRWPHRIVDGTSDLGLIYSIFESGSPRSHKTIFRFHYTELREPIVRLFGVRKVVWVVFGPLQNYGVNRLNAVYRATKRRLRQFLGLAAVDS
jgi:hypothetical protein